MSKKFYTIPTAEFEQINPKEDILLASDGQKSLDDLMNINLGDDAEWQ